MEPGSALIDQVPLRPSMDMAAGSPVISSSWGYYPDHGVTIAFQINTDIGIVDNTTTMVSEMEERLAPIAISADNAMLVNPE